MAGFSAPGSMLFADAFIHGKSQELRAKSMDCGELADQGEAVPSQIPLSRALTFPLSSSRSAS